jgi:hypothetical protein
MEQLKGRESSPSRQQCGCAVMRFHSGVGEDGDIWGERMGCGVADRGSWSGDQGCVYEADLPQLWTNQRPFLK